MSESTALPPASQQAPDAGVQRRLWSPDRRFIGYLVAGLFGINLLVAAALIYIFAQARDAEELKFRVRATTLVRLLTKDVDGQYERIDLALRQVADEYAEQLARGGREFDGWIEQLARRHQAVTMMRISDADGKIVYSTDDPRGSTVSIADREYFVRLRDRPQLGLLISPPLTGRLSGKAVIALVRPLQAADRSFNGVVVASVPLDYLENILIDRFAEPQGYAGLIDAQFDWVAAQPAAAATPPLLAALRDAVAHSPERGTFVATDQGGEQLVAYARSGLFGFYSVVGQPAVAQLAEWRRKALNGVVGMALFALVTALLGWLLGRSWKQQAETTARLIEREDWVRQAQQIGGLALFSCDLESGVFTVSEALYAITGTDAGYPHTWSGWLALVHPDDRQALDRSFAGVVAGGQAVPGVEYRIVRSLDGSVRWLKSFAHRLTEAAGRRQTITGAVVDITEQKRDEEALRKSEQLFRGVFDNSAIGIATTTADRRWLQVNQALCELLGRRREELIGEDWLDLTHPDDRAANLVLLERAVAGEIDTYEFEKRYMRSDGSVVDALVAARVLRLPDGRIDHFVTLIQDITARKQAEARLRQSEAELRVAFEQAAVGIAFVAADGRWLSVNDRLCEMVAYRRDELLGLRFQDITHADDLESDLAEVRRMLAREIDSYRQEKRYIRKDGRVIWVNITVALVWNDDRSPKHFVVIIEDIDGRIKAERESRQSRELMRSFLDHLPGLASIKDSQMRFVHGNRGLQEQLNLTHGQIVGRRNSELFPGAFGETLTALEQRVLASGQTEVMELSYGTTRYQTTKFVIPWTDGTALLGGIALDITRRSQLEERTGALLALNERGRLLPDRELLLHGLEMAEKLTGSMASFLHFVDEDQERVELSTWSAAAQRVCSAAFDSHYPISRAGIWADCCREKRPLVFNDYPRQAAKRGVPEGHTPLQRLISLPVIEQGRVRMIVGVGNKSTAYGDFDVETVQLLSNELWSIVRRSRAEAALARRLAEVTELKDKLEQAHLQLLQSEKLAAVGQLAAGVAHELNNPIGFVYSNLGTLAEYVDDLLAIDAAFGRVEALQSATGGTFDEVRGLKAGCHYGDLIEDLPKLIRESKEGLERVRKIVLDLRDFSRVGESDWQWADLEKGLDSTVNIVWNELKYKADVERVYAGLPQINCLASQLNQVFMNLLVNAAQAIETHGRIVIRTGTESDAAGAVSAVWVEIEDGGRGMSPEVQRRMFEPFFTTKPVGQGTGLGLSISFAIIERHHGRIEVRSAPGCGTCFRISLPIDGRQSGSQTAA
ncbi:PAS domain S-box protein [Accumulibacter sp.]|uniref:PAS domain S-box protein n=1 Tax=Accumulibacter sp. TaxID=2053492 RepID=UPI00260F8367|nr:PAS domain S-box protein [Accumulibacter sp.]